MKVGNLVRTALLAGACALSISSAWAEIRIGHVSAQTGGFASNGVPNLKGFNLGLQELRDSGFFGGEEIKVDYYDYRSDKHEAVALTKKLATDDGIKMIVGPNNSSETLAAGPVAAEGQILMFSAGASPAILKLGPTVYKAVESPQAYFSELVKHVATTVKPKGCYLIAIQESESFVLQRDIVKDMLVKGGVPITDEGYVGMQDSDFTAIATRIAGSGADCLFISASPEVQANVVLQAKQAGFPADGLLIGDPNTTSPTFVKIAGAAGNGAIAVTWFNPLGVNDFAKKFIASYRAKYGTDPDTFAALGYTMAYVVGDAIKRAGPNPSRQALVDAFSKTSKVPTPLGVKGEYAFDAGREPVYNSGYLLLKDGKWSVPQQ